MNHSHQFLRLSIGLFIYLVFMGTPTIASAKEDCEHVGQFVSKEDTDAQTKKNIVLLQQCANSGFGIGGSYPKEFYKDDLLKLLDKGKERPELFKALKQLECGSGTYESARAALASAETTNGLMYIYGDGSNESDRKALLIVSTELNELSGITAYLTAEKKIQEDKKAEKKARFLANLNLGPELFKKNLEQNLSLRLAFRDGKKSCHDRDVMKNFSAGIVHFDDGETTSIVPLGLKELAPDLFEIEILDLGSNAGITTKREVRMIKDGDNWKWAWKSPKDGKTYGVKYISPATTSDILGGLRSINDNRPEDCIVAALLKGPSDQNRTVSGEEKKSSSGSLNNN